jgi:fatty-acyl-CoA synthase
VIIRGGENVYPKEVEDFLYRHPKVAAVEVVGVPDYKLGEAVLAWIRLKPGVTATEEEIREFCRGEISHFKIPQYVRFVDEFPATANGKTQKYLIRQRDTELRGLRAATEMATA